MTMQTVSNPPPSHPLPEIGRRGRRIAVIGAGPGGLSAGLTLHRAGFDVRIFERHPELRPLGGAIILNATSIVILRRLGVKVDDIFAAGVPEFRRYDGRTRVRFEIDMALMQQAGVTGWQSGMMRSELYARLLQAIPPGLIATEHTLTHFQEHPDGLTVHFAEGHQYQADLVVGADGIESKVREQIWGPSTLKHLGIAVWLGWCELDGPERSKIYIHHDRKVQMGFAPLIYQGRNCFEWWFVEKCTQAQSEPQDVPAYIRQRIGHFTWPVPQILDATDHTRHLFRWVVKYRTPILQHWSKGRATILGDAAHPTSPYAAYGAGMSIEDGWFLANSLRGHDLQDTSSLAAALAHYDRQRVAYTAKTTAFARAMGRFYHALPPPLDWLRDWFLDHSRIPEKKISQGVTREAQELLRSILESADGLSV